MIKLFYILFILLSSLVRADWETDLKRFVESLTAADRAKFQLELEQLLESAAEVTNSHLVFYHWTKNALRLESETIPSGFGVVQFSKFYDNDTDWLSRGWGIYMSNNITDAESYGDFLYTVNTDHTLKILDTT